MGLAWVIFAGMLSAYVIYRILLAVSIVPGGAMKKKLKNGGGSKKLK